ncbi:hypothetical protein ABIA33_000739 [Streptacidiphilus sp. MAP12-16]|uniref:AbfB domain-containing protein n=1 Tax=Streptacidiphilus sp. MAP12-16 TaxID=3156300 RepID=UPI003515D733
MTADEPESDSTVPRFSRSIRIPPYIARGTFGAASSPLPGAAEPAPDVPAPARTPGAEEENVLAGTLPHAYLSGTDTEPSSGPDRRSSGPRTSRLNRNRWSRSRALATLVVTTAAAVSLAAAALVVVEAARATRGPVASGSALPVPASASSATTAASPLASAEAPSASAGPSAGPSSSTSRQAAGPTTSTVPQPTGGASGEPVAWSSGPSATPAAAPTIAAGGTGLAIGATSSFESADSPGAYWYVEHFLGYLEQTGTIDGANGAQQAAFTLVPGLADSSCYSFRAADGDYVRHQNFRIKQAADDGTELFREDATFCPYPGVVSGSVSFESYNYPGRYLRHRGDELWLDPDDGTTWFRSDASFQVTAPIS